MKIANYLRQLDSYQSTPTLRCEWSRLYRHLQYCLPSGSGTGRRGSRSRTWGRTSGRRRETRWCRWRTCSWTCQGAPIDTTRRWRWPRWCGKWHRSLRWRCGKRRKSYCSCICVYIYPWFVYICWLVFIIIKTDKKEEKKKEKKKKK